MNKSQASEKTGSESKLKLYVGLICFLTYFVFVGYTVFTEDMPPSVSYDADGYIVETDVAIAHTWTRAQLANAVHAINKETKSGYERAADIVHDVSQSGFIPKFKNSEIRAVDVIYLAHVNGRIRREWQWDSSEEGQQCKNKLSDALERTLKALDGVERADVDGYMDTFTAASEVISEEMLDKLEGPKVLTEAGK